MAGRVIRVIRADVVTRPGAVLVPSSEQAAMPRAAILRPLTSDMLRWKAGYTVTVDENDEITFHETEPPGPITAIIAPGHYATPAAYATAVQTALNGAGGAYTWVVSYDSGTKKFTLDPNNTLIDLMFASQPRSAALDLGFTETNKGSAGIYTAENQSFQSRHSLNVDVLAAQSFAVGIIIGHNLSSSGEARLDADSTTLVGAGLAASAADFSAVLNTLSTSGARKAYFATQSKRHLRLVINDVQNPVGYNEVAVFRVSPYDQAPGILESVGTAKRFEQISSISHAVGGAHHQVRRGRRAVYALPWKVFTASHLATWEAIDLAMPAGACFFIDFDAGGAGDLVYGYLIQGVEIQFQKGSYRVIAVQFAEALG